MSLSGFPSSGISGANQNGNQLSLMQASHFRFRANTYYPYTILRTEHARSVTHLLNWPCLSMSTQVLPLEADSFLQRPDGPCLLRSQATAPSRRASLTKPSSHKTVRF